MLKKIYWRIKNFLETDKGKKLLYEVKSFLVTFTAVFGALLGANEVLISAYDTGIFFTKPVLIEFWLSLVAALGRTLVIYVFAKFGIDYRKYTASYKK